MELEIGQILLSFITGGVLGAVLKTYLDFRKDLVTAIWEKRFKQYEKLWKITSVLPKWPQNNEATYSHLYGTCEKLKDWYFDGGGILLSNKSKKFYGNVQKNLFKIVKNKSKSKISHKDYRKIQLLFHKLRDQMTKDLTSRNRRLL